MARALSSSPELKAISNNTANICRGVTTAYTVTSFAQSLEEKGFITADARRSILGTTHTSPLKQCADLLDGVEEQVRMDAKKFESFVGIFSREAALSIYANQMENTRGKLVYDLIKSCLWFTCKINTCDGLFLLTLGAHAQRGLQ